MKFYTESTRIDEEKNFPLILMQKVYWNDRGYVTGFSLYLIENLDKFHKNEWKEIGQIKIGKKGMYHNSNKAYLASSISVEMPESPFEQLPEEYFSLGQSEEYYENLKQIGENFMSSILTSLNDVVYNLDIYKKFSNEYVMRKSLKREISELTIKGQYRRIVTGESKLTSFDFEFLPRNSNIEPMSFSIEPNSLPPSNIQVLIGKNGVGKTHLLSDMIKNIVYSQETGNGYFIKKEGNSSELFSNVVGISFSAFDNNMLKLEKKRRNKKIPYYYIGLPKKSNKEEIDKILNDDGLDIKVMRKKVSQVLKKSSNGFNDLNNLAQYFIESLENVMLNDFKYKQWKKYIKILEEDQSFAALNIVEKSKEYDKHATEEYFRRGLSSGHKIVLLIITKLSELVEEKTLVLFDEPENHLHPLLLSLLFKAMNSLLVYRNCVAIVATHSPIVLQEVPKEATYILQRVENQLTYRRPRVETFGENTGILNQEVFRMDVMKTGYYTLIRNSIINEENIMDAFDMFDSKLGSESKEIVKEYFFIKDMENNHDI